MVPALLRAIVYQTIPNSGGANCIRHGVLKVGKSGQKQSKSFIKMSGIPTSSLGGIGKASTFKQCQNKIVNSAENVSCLTFCHPCCIFFESYISAVVQTCFDTPMLPSHSQQPFRWSDLPRQTGNAIFNLLAGFIHLALPQPMEFSV
jgi:hypothetical protein